MVVIDKAHLLPVAMLQEIRFLTNFQIDSVSPLALIMVGQPELRATLQMRLFKPITQRMNIRYHLGGLESEETHQYVEHQLQVAGAQHPVFTGEALDAIYAHTRGIAREVNNVCTACLLDAVVRKEKPSIAPYRSSGGRWTTPRAAPSTGLPGAARLRPNWGKSGSRAPGGGSPHSAARVRWWSVIACGRAPAKPALASSNPFSRVAMACGARSSWSAIILSSRGGDTVDHHLHQGQYQGLFALLVRSKRAVENPPSHVWGMARFRVPTPGW